MNDISELLNLPVQEKKIAKNRIVVNVNCEKKFRQGEKFLFRFHSLPNVVDAFFVANFSVKLPV